MAGKTLLHDESTQGNLPAVEAILARGCDPDPRDKTGSTPLHYASFRGHVAIAKRLIAAGADVNARTTNNWTPLHHACGTDNLVMASLLLAAGADPRAKNQRGSTPGNYGGTEIRALLNGHMRLDRIVVKTAVDTLLPVDSAGNTPLHRCSTAAEVRALVALGAAVNAKNKEGTTPLHRVSAFGRAEAVAALIDAGAAINAKNDAQLTPLHFACRNEKEEVVGMLLAAGARTADAETRSVAAYCANPSILKMIAEAHKKSAPAVEAPTPTSAAETATETPTPTAAAEAPTAALFPIHRIKPLRIRLEAAISYLVVAERQSKSTSYVLANIPAAEANYRAALELLRE